MTTYDEYGMPVGAYSEPESLSHQALRVARAFALYRVKPTAERGLQKIRRGHWTWKSVLSLVKILIVVWGVTLYWGERALFQSSVDSCRWENWEHWASDANPHRLVFVADPQLVDPHTYPGRPWPLSAFTVKFTDKYIRRTYSKIQTVLYPDSVLFLGDLFDGGREWSTRDTKSPEEQYRKYGQQFWLREYMRFGNIFFGHWGDGGTVPRPGQPGRKIISSLPGNHDLGFGKGIQIGVRRRFNAYFGNGNRIDIIGNHTFVSVDTVSLSAEWQENPQSMQDIWKPAKDFLDDVKTQKRRLVQEELRVHQGLKRNPPFSHTVIESGELARAGLPRLTNEVKEFPTVLLTHVPLYRDEGTPCGPQRERWPPTPPPKGQESLEKDDRNAIAVRGGYQYQNVLHRETTKEIAEKVGDIQYAFSGDDHDYCEVVHRGYASGGGGIREITVKSISLAMGVRKPGVVLVSMWNPIDASGNSLLEHTNNPTLQTHLCLLPDELGILIRYATFFGLTILALSLRAALIASGRISSTPKSTDGPLLPTTKPTSAEHEKAEPTLNYRDVSFDATSSNSSTSSDRNKLQVRNANTRTRSVSPKNGYGLPANDSSYAYPLVQHAGYCGSQDDDGKGIKVWGTKVKPMKRGLALFMGELRDSFFKVAVVVLTWYFWLIWHW